MKKVTILACAAACIMVLLAFGGACLSAQEAGGTLTAAAAAFAVALAWLSAKLEKPIRLLMLSVGGATGMAAIVMAVFMENTAAMARFFLILSMLLAIVFLVGNMIRRNLSKAS